MSDIVKREPQEVDFVPVDEPQRSSFQIKTEQPPSLVTAAKGAIWRWRGWLLGALGVAVLLVVFWPTAAQTFPQIEPGSYVGTIDGVLSDEEGDRVHLYFERAPESDEVFMLIFAPGWGATKAVLTEGYSGVATLTPLTVTSAGGKLRFVGESSGPGEYLGRVKPVGENAEEREGHHSQESGRCSANRSMHDAKVSARSPGSSVSRQQRTAGVSR